MNFRLRVLTAVASCFASYAVAGPDKLYPDREAAEQMSLYEANRILRGSAPVVLTFNEDGSMLLRGGSVLGGSCVLTREYELVAYAARSRPDVYAIKFAEPLQCWTSNFWMANAQQVLNALQRWRIANPREIKAWEQQQAARKAADAVDFNIVVATYHAANPKPAIPEEVRRYKIIAESDIREKRFDAAVNAYLDGLAVAPWWPEGHFNAALILSELKQYPQAISEMRKYLRLVPNAPDARAAQDKIYEWEALASKL